MPSKKYRLEIDGPKRLEISWLEESSGIRREPGFNGRSFIIKLDGERIAKFRTAEELETEQIFHLPDNSSFRVRIDVDSNQLQVIRGGVQIGALSEALDVLAKISKEHSFTGGVFLFVLVLAVAYILVKGEMELGNLMVKLAPVFGIGLAYLVIGYLIKRRLILAIRLGVVLSTVISIPVFINSMAEVLLGSRDMLISNILLGWWSVSSLINLVVLEIRAIKVLQTVNELILGKS